MKMGGTKGGRLSRRFMGIGGGGQLTQSIKTLAENVTGKSTNTIRGMVCVCVIKIKIRWNFLVDLLLKGYQKSEVTRVGSNVLKTDQ